MGNNSKILFLKSKNSSNFKFHKYLKENYDTTVRNYILPAVFESKLGKMSFSNSEDVYNLEWGEAIQNIDSKDEITYEYGLDFFSDDPNTRAFVFIKCFMKYLKNLGYKNFKDDSIKNILSSIRQSNIFIKEQNIYKYDVIIVENLLTENIFSGFSKNEDESEDTFPICYEYKISPRLLKNILKSNTRILLLMNYDNSSFYNASEFLMRFNRMMEKVGICSFNLANKNTGEFFEKYPALLAGIDFENRIEDTLSEFSVLADDNYLREISDKYSQLYKNVKSLSVFYPIALNTESKNNIKDKNKILIKGNKKTTKLYPEWNDEIYENIKIEEIFWNIEKVKFPKNTKQISTENKWIKNLKEFKDIRKLNEYKHFIDFDYFKKGSKLKYYNPNSTGNPVFGIADSIYNSNYFILSGNIFTDDSILNKNYENREFMKNVISYLTAPVEMDLDLKSDHLPKVDLIIDSGEILIHFENVEDNWNEAKIRLSKMEFCYYRYFLERAKNNLDITTVTEEPGTEYNKSQFNKYKDLRISSKIIGKIIDYHKESFPGSAHLRPLEEMYNKRKETPYIKETLVSTLHKINKKINDRLKELTNERIIQLINISSQGKDKSRRYGIKLPAENISII